MSSGVAFRRNTLGEEPKRKKKNPKPTKKTVKKDKNIDETLGSVTLDAKSLDDSAIGSLMLE